MSLEEMKSVPINQITLPTEEKSLKEILEHLSKLNKQKNCIYLSIMLILNKYENVLKNLLQ